jgi:threonine/homoserine/homoserine lactone efflux protein
MIFYLTLGPITLRFYASIVCAGDMSRRLVARVSDVVVVLSWVMWAVFAQFAAESVRKEIILQISARERNFGE